MRIAQYTASFLAALALLGGMTACSGGGSKGHDAAPENLIAITTQCDVGSSITPGDIKVKKGDKPSFSITLQSGYSIETIYCLTGGSLVGTQFTMAPVQATDNVRVVTQNRWVGSAIQGSEVQLHRANTVPDMVEHPIVRSIDATEVIPSEQFATAELHVVIECSSPEAKFTLRTKLFGKDVVVPLALNAQGAFEANFTLGNHAQVPEGETLPDMLHFAVVREEEGRNTTHGMLFIAVRK